MRPKVPEIKRWLSQNARPPVAATVSSVIALLAAEAAAKKLFPRTVSTPARRASFWGSGSEHLTDPREHVSVEAGLAWVWGVWVREDEAQDGQVTKGHRDSLLLEHRGEVSVDGADVRRGFEGRLPKQHDGPWTNEPELGDPPAIAPMQLVA
jgi:hypothetical protein